MLFTFSTAWWFLVRSDWDYFQVPDSLMRIRLHPLSWCSDLGTPVRVGSGRLVMCLNSTQNCLYSVSWTQVYCLNCHSIDNLIYQDRYCWDLVLLELSCLQSLRTLYRNEFRFCWWHCLKWIKASPRIESSTRIEVFCFLRLQTEHLVTLKVLQFDC